jgi:hypothetical protein
MKRAERERLRQWLEKKITAQRTVGQEPRFMALEDLAQHLRLDVEYLHQLHRESALFRLVTMPDGRRHVRQEEMLAVLRRTATRPGVPHRLDQTFHVPEDLAAEIGIPLGDFQELLRTGEVGAVRVESFLRVPEEEIQRLLREIDGWSREK